MPRMINITDFLTEAEITRAHALWVANPDAAARLIDEQVIAPVLPRINTKLGQTNDARYLAYACCYVFSEAAKRGH